MAPFLDIAATSFRNLRPLRYLVVGAINTGASFGIYCLGIWYGLSVPTASLFAIVLGVMISFSTQGWVVFGNASAWAFVRFVVNAGVMYALHVGIVMALLRVEVNAYVGGFVAMAVTTSLSYFVLRDHVFRTKPSVRSGPPRG